jgi:hypothetical protein
LAHQAGFGRARVRQRIGECLDFGREATNLCLLLEQCFKW